MQPYFEGLKTNLSTMARDNPSIKSAFDAQNRYNLTDEETFVGLAHALAKENALQRAMLETAMDTATPAAVDIRSPFVVTDMAGNKPAFADTPNFTGHPDPRPGEAGLRIQEVRVRLAADSLSCGYDPAYIPNIGSADEPITAVDYEGYTRLDRNQAKDKACDEGRR